MNKVHIYFVHIVFDSITDIVWAGLWMKSFSTKIHGSSGIFLGLLLRAARKYMSNSNKRAVHTHIFRLHDTTFSHSGPW